MEPLLHNTTLSLSERGWTYNERKPHFSKSTVQFYAIGIPDLYIYSRSENGPKCAADL